MNCFVLVAASLVVPSLVVFVIFDMLLTCEYRIDHKAWERDGSPRGYFWTPPDSSEYWTTKRDVLLREWLFTTPAWIAGTRYHQRLLFWLRISVAMWPVIAFGGTLATLAFCK